MEVTYINPVLKTMVNVLSTMAHVTPTIGRPSLKEDNVARGDVTGLMSMVSKQTKGSLAITFPEPVILDITKRMLQQDVPAIDEMVTDLVGEITNMVTGGAKALLELEGYDFDMSLPTVVSGKNHLIEHISEGQKILLPFATDVGDFYVELCFEG